MSEFKTKCVDTIRVLSADMVEKANSGHPGAPMGCAPIAHVLFSNSMNYSPQNPSWFNRDRFVLSNGHACALLYSMLHLTGYGLSIEDLKQFRQLGSLTPGHPENILTPGVEVSTGPLGQGLTNAVGMAIAEKHLAAIYNQQDMNVVDHYTFVLCGDGCLQEGITSEACSLAGHLSLGKLIVCYDDNQITIDGNTNISFTEDVNMRFESYHWHVQTVHDGNDLEALQLAIQKAKADSRPSIIKIRTVIGYGSSKEGTGGVHGAPLGQTDLKAVKQKFGFDPEQSFVVPDVVAEHYLQCGRVVGAAKEEAWQTLMNLYQQKYPELAASLQRAMKGELPDGWIDLLPGNAVPEGKVVGTRNHSYEVLNALAVAVPELIGGSADLTGSNLTALKCSHGFQKESPNGRYIHFGVREHSMAAICNGILAHGALRPFCATFLNFIGYALGAVRVSALSNLGVIYIMTHDSIGLGEDGPTHQPIEMLESLRSIPNLLTLRPADRNETKGAYMVAMQHIKTPSVLSFSRQAVPYIAGTSYDKVALGGYVTHDLRNDNDALPHPTLILIGTGTELTLAVQVAQALHAKSVASGASAWFRVVSMPCCELFDQQTMDYQLSVLLPGAPVMSIEAGGITGWRKYAHAPFGIDMQFGFSAPAEDLYKHFGFGVPNLIERAEQVISFYQPVNHGSDSSTTTTTHPVAPSLLNIPRFPVIASHH